MLDPSLTPLAVTGVILLISFLSYAPQLFLLGPYLSQNQWIFFNTLVGAIWITYYRTITTAPGSPPRDWTPATDADGDDAEEGRGRAGERRLVVGAGKWCRRCEGYRPVRAHHCRTCNVCVLRMDHHCPWTANCIGFRNLPHFLRFLCYSAFTTFYLLTHLFSRCNAVWSARNAPASSSPHTTPQLLLLTALTLLCIPTTFALSILTLRTLFSVTTGYTTIETWEQDRHDALVSRKKVPRQEFPYDIGLWDNLCAAFGYTGNILSWLWPFSRTLEVGELLHGSGDVMLKGGLEWEVNGYEDVGLLWPPVDPDKFSARGHGKVAQEIPEQQDGEEWVEGVRRRQRADWEVKMSQGRVGRAHEELRYPRIADRGSGWGSEWEWRNGEGESLADYGVAEEEEEEEVEGDEDVPLGVLLRRRREAAAAKQGGKGE